jgi:quercetin dioxygenase-like cupin family protein
MTTFTASAALPHVAHQGEPVWYGDSLFEFLVPSEATGGRLTVFRATCPQGFGPPRHVHTREDEVFLVVDGDVRFDVDGRLLLAGPGTTISMPRGVPHTFRIESPVATMLGVIAPGDFEHVFRNLSVPARERAVPPPGAAPLDVKALAAELAVRGTRVVGPPIAG